MNVPRVLFQGVLFTLALSLAVAGCSPSGSTRILVGPGGSYYFSDGDATELRWNDDGVKGELDVQGDVEFTADDADVARLDADGRFEARTDGRGVRREVVIEPTGQGLGRRYYVDGVLAEWDGEAAAWLAGVVAEVQSRTTLGAAARARRLLDAGGPDALVAALPALENGAVQSLYVGELLGAPGLEPAHLRGALAAADRISSESSRAALAARIADHAPGDRELTRELLDLAAGITGSSTRADVLEKVAVRRDLDGGLTVRAIGVAAGISSESTRSVALDPLLGDGGDPAVRDAWLEAVTEISGSSTKGAALEYALKREGLDGAGVSGVIAAATTISSESSRASVLVAALRRGLANEEVRAVWLGAAAEITGSSTLADLLVKFLADSDDASTATLAQVADTSRKISSESARASVLEPLVGRAPVGPALDATLAAIDTLSGSSVRASVLQRALERDGLDRETLRRMAKSVEGISSTSLRAELQTKVIARLAGEE